MQQCADITARLSRADEWGPMDFVDAALGIESAAQAYASAVEDVHTSVMSLHSTLVVRHVRQAPLPLIAVFDEAHIPQDVEPLPAELLTRNAKRRNRNDNGGGGSRPRPRSVHGGVARDIVVDALECGGTVFQQLLDQPSPARQRASGERQPTPLAPPPPMESGGLWCAASVTHVSDAPHIGGGGGRASASNHGGTTTMYHSASRSPAAASSPSLMSMARGGGGGMSAISGAGSPPAAEEETTANAQPLKPTATGGRKVVAKAAAPEPSLVELLHPAAPRVFLNAFAATTSKRLAPLRLAPSSSAGAAKKKDGAAWHSVGTGRLPDDAVVATLATCRGEDDVLAFLPGGFLPRAPPCKDGAVRLCHKLTEALRQDLCAVLGAGGDMSEDAADLAGFVEGNWHRLSLEQQEAVEDVGGCGAATSHGSPSVVGPSQGWHQPDAQSDDDDADCTMDVGIHHENNVAASHLDFPLKPYVAAQFDAVRTAGTTPLTFEDIMCRVVGSSQTLNAPDISRHFLAILCSVTDGSMTMRRDDTMMATAFYAATAMA